MTKGTSQPPMRLVAIGEKPEYLIVQSPEFYFRVARSANDEVLLRACLMLAARQIERWHLAHILDEVPENERGIALPEPSLL